jgi:predicted esterase/ketosteroid isomerase-like protein
MWTKTLWSGASVFILLFAGCAGGSIPTLSQDESDLREALSDFITAMNEGDAPVLEHCLASNATLFNSDGGEMFYPVAYIPEGLPPVSQDYSVGPVDIKISGDSALVTGYLYATESEKTESETAGPCALSVFWLREEGKWKISHFHSSPVTLTPLRYLVAFPKGYNARSGSAYPLIVFLHGSGERGDDLEAVRRNGLPKVVEGLADYPFITISPQCPRGATWPMLTESLSALLKKVVHELPVDARRIYLTGLSMGGYGTWFWAMAHPDLFAAIAPVSGMGDPTRASRIRNLPVWAFHGAKDEWVPVKNDEMTVEALEKARGNVRFTVYPEGRHDIWDRVYTNPELYRWFLSHSRPVAQ